MGRHRERTIHVWSRKDSPYWQIWFYSDKTGKRIRQATDYKKSEYSRDAVRRLLNNHIEVQGLPEYTIEWLERYVLEDRKSLDRAPKTLGLYHNSFRHLKDYLGKSRDIRSIKRLQADEFRIYLKGRDLANATVNSYLRHVAAAFELMVIHEKIDKNPFYKFKRLPKTERKEYMTREEAKYFLNIIEKSENEKAKRLIRILLFTGVRRGELLLVHREDIDLKRREFYVQNIKDKRRPRRRHAIIILDRLLKDFEYFLSLWNSPLPFRVCQPDTLTHWTKQFLREAGFSEDLHLHSLRHTFSTLAEESGYRPREIQRQLGHASYSTTEIYLHDDFLRSGEIDIGL